MTWQPNLDWTFLELSVIKSSEERYSRAGGPRR